MSFELEGSVGHERANAIVHLRVLVLCAHCGIREHEALDPLAAATAQRAREAFAIESIIGHAALEHAPQLRAGSGLRASLRFLGHRRNHGRGARAAEDSIDELATMVTAMPDRRAHV